MKFHRSLHPNSTAGYTLIEMMAIVIIIAVLAAIAAPSWLAYATRQRMNAVESDLVQVLKQARETAVSRRSDIHVRIQEAEAKPTVDVIIGELANPRSTRTEVLGPGDLPDDAIILRTPDDPDNVITFDYQGTIRDSASTEFVVEIRPVSNDNDDRWRQCAAVATLLGNVKTARGADCDDF